MDSSQATWENHQILTSVFLDFNLENKVIFNEGGIVTNNQVGNNARRAKESIVELVRRGGHLASGTHIEEMGKGHVSRRLTNVRGIL